MAEWMDTDDPRSLHQRWMTADTEARAALRPLLQAEERRYALAVERAWSTRGQRLAQGVCGHCAGRKVLAEVVRTDRGPLWVATYSVWMGTESLTITDRVLLEWPEPHCRPGWLQARCRDHGRASRSPTGASRAALQAHAVRLGDPANQGSDSTVAVEVMAALAAVRSRQRTILMM